MPGIIRFLGYVPEPASDDFVTKILWARHVLGQTRVAFADAMGVPCGTLAGWEQGKHAPSARRRKEVEYRLKGLGVYRDRVHPTCG